MRDSLEQENCRHVATSSTGRHQVKTVEEIGRLLEQPGISAVDAAQLILCLRQILLGDGHPDDRTDEGSTPNQRRPISPARKLV